MTEDVLYERGLNQKRAKNMKVFPRLLRYALPHWRLFLLGLLFLGIATAADVAGPIVLKRFIDRYLTPLHFPFRPILFLAVLYFTLIVLSTVFHYIQFVTLNRLAQRAIRAIRMDVFQKVERMPMSFFDRTPVGWIVSRITNDTEAIQQLYVSVLSTYIQHTVFLVLIYGAMFIIDVRMALIMLVLLPIIVALMVTYRKVSTPVVRRTREKLSEINTMLSETLSGMRTVQAFRQEQRLLNRFSKLTEGYYRAFLSQIRVNGLLVRPFVDLLYLASIVAVLTVFGWRSMVGWVEIGTLVAFLSYIDRMFEPVNEMMFALTFFQQAHIAGERVFTLMDEGEVQHHMHFNGSPQPSSNMSIKVQEKTAEEAAASPTIRRGEITFDRVSFSYDGRHPVLKNISFTAKPGMTVALVGHTGSGKSTIANLLLRFYTPDEGEIRIDGQPIDRYPEEMFRQQVGLVLQEPHLFRGDVAFNIRLNDAYSDEAIREAARFVQADRFIERLKHGYHEPVTERGSTFSTGERQLIAFARTMLRQPKILILDEATASIDTETEQLIQEALRRMRQGRTTIIIAHRLSTIMDADLILVLSQGEIVEQGRHDALLAQGGLYRAMYEMQSGLRDVGEMI